VVTPYKIRPTAAATTEDCFLGLQIRNERNHVLDEDTPVAVIPAPLLLDRGSQSGNGAHSTCES
jgi:hypothetical protein